MRWVALVAAASVTAGCFLTSEPVDRLELSVTLSAVQVYADSGMTIRVMAINRSDRAVYLTGRCPLGYDLVPPTDVDQRLYREGGCRSGAIEPQVDRQSLDVPARAA
jgi:hypothetical protein